MKRVLAFVAGIFVGQWLAFSAVPSPAHLHRRAVQAFNQHDDVDAMRLGSEAISIQPDNATFHYMRGRALALLGLRMSAADAYQTSLLLGPPRELAKKASEALASLASPPAVAAAGQPAEVVVPLEPGRGVWTTAVRQRRASRPLPGRHRPEAPSSSASPSCCTTPALASTASSATPSSAGTA